MILNKERIINSSLTLDKESLKMIKISDEEYFGDNYKDFVSNSGMKYINPSQGGDPYLYKYGDKSFNGSFLDLGSILHSKILENIDPKLYIGNIPTGKMMSMLQESIIIEKKTGKKVVDIADEIAEKFDYYRGNGKLFIKNAIKYREYYRFLQIKEDQSYIITPEAKEKLDKIESIIPIIQSLFVGDEVFFETTLLADFVYNNTWNENKLKKIIKSKAKIDNFIINHEKKEIILNDLKTTYHKVSDFMDSFDKFHYARQFSFYLFLLKNFLNLNDYTLKANVIVVSTTDCDFGVYKISQNHIEEGFNEWSDCLKRIGFHETYGYDLLINEL